MKKNKFSKYSPNFFFFSFQHFAAGWQRLAIVAKEGRGLQRVSSVRFTSVNQRTNLLYALNPYWACAGEPGEMPDWLVAMETLEDAIHHYSH